MKEIVQKYLRIAGFTKIENKSQYLLRNLGDIAASLAYAVISGVFVIHDETSLLVLLLNGLCISRIILKNAMESSRITFIMRQALEKETNLNAKMITGNHYYHKSLAQIMLFAVSAIVVIGVGFDTKIVYVKILTILIIAIIFLDDLDSMCINLYNADIDPFRVES